MQKQPLIPFSQLGIPELLRLHNDLAPERREPRLKSWRGSRCHLVERVALLRARTPIPLETKTTAKRPKRTPPKKRKTFVRTVILKMLAHVAGYEDAKTGERVSKKEYARRKPGTVHTVGLSYSEIAARIKRKYPVMTVSPIFLRVTANAVRNRLPGHENCILPHKRPHGGKGKPK